MFSKKNLSAFYWSVLVSAVFITCWILLSLLLNPPFAFSGSMKTPSTTIFCLKCFLFAAIPFVFVFLLARRQINCLMAAQSRLKQAEDAFEDRLNSRTADLEQAMANIKTLRGIVTICANCKSIRNGNGKWEAVEAYLHRHTEAQFSHGLCKECQETLYGKNYSLRKTAQAD